MGRRWVWLRNHCQGCPLVLVLFSVFVAALPLMDYVTQKASLSLSVLQIPPLFCKGIDLDGQGPSHS